MTRPVEDRRPSVASKPNAQPQTTRILIVDDDPVAADSLADYLAEDGNEPATAFNGAEAIALLAQAESAGRPFAVVICDVAMPGMSGPDLLRRVSKEHPSAAVLMLTGYGTIESAVESVRMGAVDYLTKPVVDSELRLALERARRQHALMSENRQLRQRLDDRLKGDGLDGIIGSDHRMHRIFDLIGAVAPSKTTVLMTGESGVGKSLIASAIHQRSPRGQQGKPFIQLSCGSIPETLLESELFGHVKGAFTGAHADKVGRFLAADGGTIFLDEINSASPAMQLKLLRVLQERRFEPVGSSETIEVDVRVVLATNKPLEEMVARGDFRQDLYYRINVVTIDVPPLRDRISDIAPLMEHFLNKHAANLGRTFVGFSPEAVDALRRYRYPGNVRELENIVERAAVLAKSPTIGVQDLPDHVTGAKPGLVLSVPGNSAQPGGEPVAWTPIPLEDALKDPERRIILRALAANGWNRQKTAEDLHINRTTLYKKMKALGIEGADDERLAG
ncbi:MAG: sigma-54-dependent Fis family transcriptional regulator [Phycisphaerales bacterium]|nr:sigma-54-dependent Fis family transcriptional regulator [Phycisphaerales bacterium]